MDNGLQNEELRLLCAFCQQEFVCFVNREWRIKLQMTSNSYWAIVTRILAADEYRLYYITTIVVIAIVDLPVVEILKKPNSVTEGYLMLTVWTSRTPFPYSLTYRETEGIVIKCYCRPKRCWQIDIPNDGYLSASHQLTQMLLVMLKLIEC